MAECFVRLNPGAVCIKVDNDATIERSAALKPRTKNIESFGSEMKCSVPLNKTFVYKSSVSFCIVYFRKAGFCKHYCQHT